MQILVQRVATMTTARFGTLAATSMLVMDVGDEMYWFNTLESFKLKLTQTLA